MATFVLAHLSDPHLGPLPRPRIGELFGKRAVGFANWLRKRRALHRSDVLARIVDDLKAHAPDHIAVTGDLVNLSLADEYAPARAWLERLGGPQHVTMVPGNHDAYVRGAADHPRMHWGDYMRGDGAGNAPVAGSQDFPFVRRCGPLALIGLSSAVPTGPLMATGRLGGEQLRRLAETLERLGREALFRVVMIHHPPVSKRSRHFKRLVDGAALRDALARHGTELLIHGHDHTRSLVWLDGPHGRIPAVGVASASELPPGEHDPAGYNLFRIEGSPRAWRCEAVSRGFSRDGNGIVELKRTMLVGNQR